MRRLILPAALAACVVASACTDSTGPVSVRTSFDKAVSDGGADGSQLHILHEASTAPPLETYQASFKACRGKPAALRIDYLSDGSGQKKKRKGDGHKGGADQAGSFLLLSVPAKALARYPDGRKIKEGRCVQISVTVDPSYLVAEFQPAGLVFDSSHPAELTFWYTWADLDLDEDGDRDAKDEAIEEFDLGVWRLPHGDGVWHELYTLHYTSEKRFETDLYQFSHYAIAH